MIIIRVFNTVLAHFTSLALWLMLSALLLLPNPACALEPERREVVVVNARVWDGYEYKEIFVPSTKQEMTLISGRESAIVFVRTLEYYWPLSRQVYVDFERQRDVIRGELVIRRNDEVVAREALQSYAILYSEGVVNGNAQLLWGRTAEHAYARHQEDERRFVRDFSAARKARAEYERRLVQSGATSLRGGPVEIIEPPPAPPSPSLRLVTAPTAGFRVELEPGIYSLAIEEAGHAVPGTRRTLRVIGLSESEALVGDIVPEERWTKPLPSNSESARIFVRPGTAFYLTLAEASRFDEAEYLPVVQPQAQPVRGRTMWVRRKPAQLDRLKVTWNAANGKIVSRHPFKVEQTRGASFGYRVRSAQNGEKPDLDAFEVLVPSEPAVSHGQIMVAAQPPFEREIVVVHPRNPVRGLALALLPIVGYLSVRASRRALKMKQRPRWL